MKGSTDFVLIMREWDTARKAIRIPSGETHLQKSMVTEAGHKAVSGSCNLHASDVDGDKEGPTERMLNAVHEDAFEGVYGTWVVVTRKKTRNTRSRGTSPPQESVQPRQLQGRFGFDLRTIVGPGKTEHNNESLREAERKHLPSRVIIGAQL